MSGTGYGELFVGFWRVKFADSPIRIVWFSPMTPFFYFQDDVTVSGNCLGCGKCCRNLVLVHRGKPVRLEAEFEALKKTNPFYENMEPVGRSREDALLYFWCRLLREDNSCGDYERRPAMCRSYPDPKVFRLGGRLLSGCGYRVSPRKDFARVLEESLNRSPTMWGRLLNYLKGTLNSP